MWLSAQQKQLEFRVSKLCRRGILKQKQAQWADDAVMELQPFIEPGVWGETVQITEIRPFTWQRSETWEGWSAQTGTQSLFPHLQPLFIRPRLNRKPRDYIKQTLRLPCSYYSISACFPLVIPSILFGISFHKTWKMKLYMCVCACMCVWWILKQTVVSKSDCTYLFPVPHLFLKTAEWYWHSLSKRWGLCCLSLKLGGLVNCPNW